MNFALPAAYKKALKGHDGGEIHMDWAKLHRKEPPNWPGSFYLWPQEEATAENERLEPLLYSRGSLYFIGNNVGGQLFALDRKARILVVDPVAMDDDTVVIAPSLDALLSCRVSEADSGRALRRDVTRGLSNNWKRIEDLISKPKSFDYHFLPDRIEELHAEYSIIDKLPEFHERLKELRRRHPGKRSLFARLKRAGVMP